LTPPEGRGPPGARATRKRDRVANPDLPKLIRHYETEFERTQGATPLIQQADAIAAASVLRGRTFVQAAGLVTRFLEQPDQFTKSHGLLRLRDLPGMLTKILARSSPGSGTGSRAPDGTPVGEQPETITDTVAVDEAGVRRRVRIFLDRASGRELRRRWGSALEVTNG
jgi:hypothetical protein